MEIDLSLSAVPKIKSNFADRLIAAIKRKGNPICVGLDPRLKQIPKFIKEQQIKQYGETKEAAARCLLEFNKGIIDAVADLVPCVKPQIAFYEEYGFHGIWAFEETCRYAHDKELLVIADAKRNDIGSTAEGYARAYLGEIELFGEKISGLNVDALTVTPYLGYDGVKPFVDSCCEYGKGIFVLLKTSNPSSGDLQDQLLDEKVAEGFGVNGRITTYELMAHLIESWGADLIGDSGYSSIGAVVGATYPKQAEQIRKLLPQAIFLVPGYGAQGGGASDVKPCFDEDGLGAIVNSSRGIIFAYEKSEIFSPESYAEAARVATLEMARELEIL
ncbi:MAG: orotidine 5'-phosphate decarboxylase, orotidine-5'-phosphate decarboxylase [Candidatus Peregrinibacteria bacterium GW2011_GWE2_39_6]|nr:MAG: orotidine 5'-phosphate decarboxylase, orotidine-5'-phosphate decarboxylase [Candidatus Peregrinibacteria bacterium GW2011_GWF2_39_17]KKR24584.1 MAG: orotidine 5'-phosphate decarboxylase, orotidine-5'-phosphate decarboxylase [Candidatus Peregrinibacteria bacterium GW2011_GWE2_39_6]HCW32689.1 orotidine-5'-phosphate decarboxylase [Candidatus Peregrinibacteria bacterium]